MGRKKKEKKEKLSFFERRHHTFNSESGTTHEIFVNITDNQRITPTTEKGVRVLVARYPDFYKLYFYQYMPPNSPSYPRGGIKVWNATYEQMQCFYFESVALHPDGGCHKFYDREE